MLEFVELFVAIGCLGRLMYRNLMERSDRLAKTNEYQSNSNNSNLTFSLNLTLNTINKN